MPPFDVRDKIQLVGAHCGQVCTADRVQMCKGCGEAGSSYEPLSTLPAPFLLAGALQGLPGPLPAAGPRPVSRWQRVHAKDLVDLAEGHHAQGVLQAT